MQVKIEKSSAKDFSDKYVARFVSGHRNGELMSKNNLFNRPMHFQNFESAVNWLTETGYFVMN